MPGLLQKNFRFYLFVWFSLLVVTGICRLFLLPENATLSNILVSSVYFSTVYFAIVCLFLRYSVWCLSLVWLALPSLLFVVGWLRWYWAVPLLVLWVSALARTISIERNAHWRLTGSQFAGLVLVLVWVYFSGAGGYGHQSPDYIMHNGRLLDLIRESWPVHFSDGLWVRQPNFGLQHSYLIGYLGYYLPAALLGKLFGEQVAFEFMHIWTLVGCWLAVFWLWQLVGRAWGVWAALCLLFFGGWDAIGVLVSLFEQSVQFHQPFNWMTVGKFFSELHLDTGSLDFWPVSLLQYFLGGYLSNAAELYWSPHQTIAAWVCVGAMLYAFLQRRFAVLCFVFALLAFWSPMNMVPMAVLLVFMLFSEGRQSVYLAMTWENVLAGGAALLLFSVFYLAGSVSDNPLSFAWKKIHEFKSWGWFFLFHVLSWGVYAAVIFSNWKEVDKWQRVVASPTFLSLFLLSLVFYGQYNDLLCRGITSLYFVLLVLMLRNITFIYKKNNFLLLGIVTVLLIPGFGSGIAHAQRAWLHRMEKVQGQSVINYGSGWEFLGRSDSFFVKNIAKKDISAIEPSQVDGE